MQFTRIRLSAGSTNIDLPFLGLQPSSTYILKAADGLGPTEVDIRMENGIYLGRELQDREIVLRVGLNPSYVAGQTAASMRETLYRLLTPGPSDSIIAKMMNGATVVAQTVGYIKRIEVAMFTKDPEVQIVIACDGPYLSAPASLESVPSTKSSFVVNNIGQVTTGFYIDLELTADRSSFTFYSEDDNSGPRLAVTYAFLTGDRFVIDTRSGQKSVKVIRGSSTENVIRGLSDDSLWFELHPGENTFWVGNTTFDWNKIVYKPLYWGM